ncbi:MAG: M66 family metalloprotease [Gemmatimonadetes bacterium]|nr:M66 family metalloprotease [Gemmatimonadota bacterium]
MWKHLAIRLCLAVTLVAATWTGDVGIVMPQSVSAQGASCPGDFNGDGKVNLADFLAFAGGFGARSGDAKFSARLDLDGSGAIDLSDFLAFAGVFGTTCEDRSDGSVATDRDALVALYNATDGQNWVNSENWLTDAPLGDWYGVVTDGSGRVIVLSLRENGLIGGIPPELSRLANLSRLNLSSNQLNGQIPPTLAKLTKLSDLSLDSNALSGPIPRELGGIRGLARLGLEENQLTGPIPPELGNLRSLGRLDLSYNNLTGPIPLELGNLRSLDRLDLSFNSLTGPIPPELGNLMSVSWLVLRDNQLTGPIPPELGSLTNLTDLSVWDNNLTGPIPPELGNLALLKRLSLAHNHLSGPVPPELGKLVGLESLYLSGNLLTGSLPLSFLALNKLNTIGCTSTEGVCVPATDEFWEWARQIESRGNVDDPVDIPLCDQIDRQALVTLYEAANGADWTRSDRWIEEENLDRWHGVQTDSIGRVSGLNLSGNGLSGYVPNALGLLANMKKLQLRDNALTGRLPLSLTELTLEEFDYGGTSLCVADDTSFQVWLSGISRHRGTGVQCPPLTDREILEWLYRNTDGPNWRKRAGWLTDAPLAEWHGVKTDATGRVVELRLGGNDLSGSLPVELRQLSKLRILDLHRNRISGSIPPELGDLGRLKELDFWGNQLSGNIPSQLGQLSELTVLQLSRNRLSGSVPPELGDLSRLQRLDIRGNQLSGEIPRELGKLAILTELDIERNFLSGALPPALGQLSRLIRLELAGNLLSGSIPSELGKLSAMEFIGLGENQLTGSIPPQLGALGRLSSLDLSGNQLTGRIPSELGGLAGLREFRLSGNDISGSIPSELGRSDNLTVLSLADNQLSGPIPSELGRLGNLVTLNLGNNQLSGPLPSHLGHATSLESLDLRSNQLTGTVPREFGSLTYLKSLILADNPTLAGPLPPGIAALERIERFMAGGTGLCRPADSGFDAWFQGIPERRLLRCEGGAAVYMTQTVQSWHEPVPLLADEPALLRVFVTAPGRGTATMPDVRATFYLNGHERHSVHIAPGTRSIPMDVTESDLGLSANAEIPGPIIEPGLQMVIEVDPRGTMDPALGVTKRIPESGRMAIDVRTMPPFQLTLIPVVLESDPDLSVVETVSAMAADPHSHELLRDVRTLLPVSALAVTAHAVVSIATKSPRELVARIQAMRLMEGGAGHWMGVYVPPERRPGVFYAPGGAYISGYASVGEPHASTIVHELGHNLGLLHAPCGPTLPTDTDPWFPYPNGRVGAWGYDFEHSALVPPHAPDIMSYCYSRSGGYWISDFFFNKALNHRLANAAATAAKPAAQANPVPTLLLWGGRDKDGVPYLDPSFAVDAVPSVPQAAGEYTIEGGTTDGMSVFTYTFDMPVTGCSEGKETSFVFALPLQPEWAGNLASITLSGPGGSATLDGSTDRPMAILRDLNTGQVRGFLSDLTAEESAQAAEGVFAAKPGVEVLFSRGIPEFR